MSNNTNSAAGGGLGCLTVLGLIFVGLKLAEVGKVAAWSWWWVLAPFWVQPLIVAILFISLLFVAIVTNWLQK